MPTVYTVDAQCSNTIRVEYNVSQMSKLNVIHFVDSVDICQMKFLQLGKQSCSRCVSFVVLPLNEGKCGGFAKVTALTARPVNDKN